MRNSGYSLACDYNKLTYNLPVQAASTQWHSGAGGKDKIDPISDPLFGESGERGIKDFNLSFTFPVVKLIIFFSLRLVIANYRTDQYSKQSIWIRYKDPVAVGSRAI